MTNKVIAFNVDSFHLRLHARSGYVDYYDVWKRLIQKEEYRDSLFGSSCFSDWQKIVSEMIRYNEYKPNT